MICWPVALRRVQAWLAPCCNLEASADLLVVGAYPPGQQWDLRRGEPGDRPAVLANIEAVPLPGTDPMHGPGGPLVALWRAAAAGARP